MYTNAELINKVDWVYTSFYIKDLSILVFWYPKGSWNQFSADTEEWLCQKQNFKTISEKYLSGFVVGRYFLNMTESSIHSKRNYI